MVAVEAREEEVDKEAGYWSRRDLFRCCCLVKLWAITPGMLVVVGTLFEVLRLVGDGGAPLDIVSRTCPLILAAGRADF